MSLREVNCEVCGHVGVAAECEYCGKLFCEDCAAECCADEEAADAALEAADEKAGRR